ncbi:MAG TPA: AAA-associated domain-containing protein, partial [Burkholderiaceae bacterium]|nr:AAA-associated domain-containing protein [Burkholderiaceae bacterium]
RLPDADVSRMDGLLERLGAEPFGGHASLPRLAEAAAHSDARLLPLAHGLALLGLAQFEHGDLQLTALGRRYVDGHRTLRQELFGQQLLSHVPLAAHIRHSLEQEPSGQLAVKPFLRLLRERLDPAEADRVLRTVIAWGRHGEVFEYDDARRRIRLPTGETVAEEAGPG